MAIDKEPYLKANISNIIIRRIKKFLPIYLKTLHAETTFKLHV